MWKGFLKESKSYMSYNKRNLKDKIKFWLQFPEALIKFKHYEHKDNIRIKKIKKQDEEEKLSIFGG